MGKALSVKSRIDSGKAVFAAIFAITETIIVLSLLSAAYSSETDIKRTVMVFFQHIHHQRYQEAYAFFSSAIKQEVSFPLFRERASSIKKIYLKELILYDHDRYLAKIRIKAKLSICYKGKHYAALYGGTCNLQLEKGRWKVASVDLKPLEQKEVLEKKTIHFSN